MSEAKESKICEFCAEKTSKYCCPRCGVLYCSLDCYKSEKHSECSESFYRECVNEELSSQDTNDESRRKMIGILKNMNNSDLNDPDFEHVLEDLNDCEEIDSDDNDESDILDRMKDIDLNDADAVWEALNEDERNEFVAMLNQGEVGALVPHWEPWWLYQEEEKLIQDVNNKDLELTEALKQCPALKEVQKISSLTTIQPSPTIKFNIVNVLASYAFVMRYFNGELTPVEGTTYILNICSNLDQFTNFEDLATAVESVKQRCLQSDIIYSDEESLLTMRRDTYLILQGPSPDNNLHYCKAALSHTYETFNEAKKAGKTPKTTADASKEKLSEFSKKFPEHQTEHLAALDVGKVKKSIKKLEYYLSFVESFGLDFEV